MVNPTGGVLYYCRPPIVRRRLPKWYRSTRRGLIGILGSLPVLNFVTLIKFRLGYYELKMRPQPLTSTPGLCGPYLEPSGIHLFHLCCRPYDCGQLRQWEHVGAYDAQRCRMELHCTHHANFSSTTQKFNNHFVTKSCIHVVFTAAWPVNCGIWSPWHIVWTTLISAPRHNWPFSAPTRGANILHCN